MYLHWTLYVISIYYETERQKNKRPICLTPPYMPRSNNHHPGPQLSPKHHFHQCHRNIIRVCPRHLKYHMRRCQSRVCVGTFLSPNAIYSPPDHRSKRFAVSLLWSTNGQLTKDKQHKSTCLPPPSPPPQQTRVHREKVYTSAASSRLALVSFKCK